MRIAYLECSKNRAATLLITILIISAITLSIALSVALTGIGQMRMGADYSQSAKALNCAKACMDEALLQLIRNQDYNGGDLTVNGTDCNISIDKSNSNPTIIASGKFNQFTKKITIEFDLTNKKILSWREI
ncbi:MAG: hypothetical protein AAB465_00505 [Patescibacteria group bacterium]